MKRRLLKFYRQKIPYSVKNAVPEAISAHVAGGMYRLYSHPDLAFYHARYLSKIGKGHKAAKRYMQVKSGVINDPLFKCSFKAACNAPNVPVISGQYHVAFCYAGIKVIGVLQDTDMQHIDRVDIYLDDQLLRSEQLTVQNGTAHFHFAIKRATLELFNSDSVLSLRIQDDRYLAINGLGTHIALHIPHGSGGITAKLRHTGTLDKKGNTRPLESEVALRHQAYLGLYERAHQFFKQEFQKSLILVCGTLLGQHREGGFIPGDDDFDVGYVSDMINPLDVRNESVEMIKRMVAHGFTILLNREGKPFRISDAISGLGIHLDVTPIFSCNDGHVWMHKLARLSMDIQDMRNTEMGNFSGTSVEKPCGAETYLSQTYGENWRHPDPNFSYADWTTPAEVMNGLRATCISPVEQRHMKVHLNKGVGKFIPIGLQPLYPLAQNHMEEIE